MQPGYPPPGQDPYGQQQPQQDPYGQPQQPQQPQYGQPQQPPYQDPYAQPQQPAYQDPYAQPQQPTSGGGYPTSGGGAYPGPTSGGAYPASGYGTPGYGPPAQPQNTQGLVSMILGIVSIPLLCCFGIGILPGIAAIVLGYLGLNKVKEGTATNKGMALAGLICGGVTVGLFVLSLILRLAGVGTYSYNY